MPEGPPPPFLHDRTMIADDKDDLQRAVEILEELDRKSGQKGDDTKLEMASVDKDDGL